MVAEAAKETSRDVEKSGLRWNSDGSHAQPCNHLRSSITQRLHPRPPQRLSAVKRKTAHARRILTLRHPRLAASQAPRADPQERSLCHNAGARGVGVWDVRVDVLPSGCLLPRALQQHGECRSSRMVRTIRVRCSMLPRLRFVSSSRYGRPPACCELLRFQRNCNNISGGIYLSKLEALA